MADLCTPVREETLTMASIPVAGDLIDAIGPFAERVENRSLLLDKFVFHKQWGLGELKANDAHRWTLLRISENGPAVLNRESQDKKAQAQRLAAKNPEKSQRLKEESDIAASLASTRVESGDLTTLRAKHTRRFISLFRSAFGARAVILVGQLEGRLAINLADSLIQNAGITLDRLFGMPYVQGSAIKGVSRHAALEELKASSNEDRVALFESFRAVFGTADNDFTNGDLRPFRDLLNGRSENQRGSVSFLPAYSLNEARVVVDLTNVHYPDYYRTGRTEELSNERPLPNPFPVVEIGAQFAFCMVLNRPGADAGIIDAARRWLETALTTRGLGAKTASGYGWFSLQPQVIDQIIDEEGRTKTAADAKAKQAADAATKEAVEAARIAAMPPSEAAREKFAALNEEAFAKTASELSSLGPDEQIGLLLALLGPLKKETWKRWKKSDKPANKARVAALLAAATSHGVSLP